MARFGMLITWTELTGTEPTLALLREHLASFALNSVLIGLARITAILRTWQNQPNFSIDQGLAQKLLPTHYATIKRLYASGVNRMIFTRLTLLFVAKQACIACGTEGVDVNSAPAVERLLSCCPMANDIVLSRQPEPDDTAIEKAVSLLPFTNYMPQDTYPFDLARSILLIEDIAPLLAMRRDYIDLATAFTAATGLATRKYCELAFASAIKFIGDVETQLREPADAFILHPTYFRRAAIPAESVSTFLTRSLAWSLFAGAIPLTTTRSV